MSLCPTGQVPQANMVDERTNVLVEEYSTSGRLDNITQVMSLHTQYLESFLRSQFYMLRMDGPLPLPHRHYIAIMVRVPLLPHAPVCAMRAPVYA